MSTETKCPRCAGELKKIFSRARQKHYWACQSASEECGQIFSDQDGKPRLPAQKGEALDDMPCPACGSPMRRVEGAKGPFFGCTKYPGCREIVDIGPDGKPAPLCPEDEEHGPMKLRAGKNGQFWSCSKWKDAGCKATREMDGSVRGKKEEAA